MDMRRLTLDARLSFARLPGFAGSLGVGKVPDAPQQTIRDLWPGDPILGARLMKGELLYRGFVHPLSPGAWSEPADLSRGASGSGMLLRAHAQGFTWLRHLRALGTDGARLRARALVAEWLARPGADPLTRAPDVIGARVNAWLTQYDFFAASADDGFKQRLMTRIAIDARTLAALAPFPMHDHRALAAYKGLLACAVAMPEQNHLLTRYMRHIAAEIGRQVLLDGCHVERSPSAHFAALRELAEMRALMQSGHIAPPLALSAALDRMAPALRALRHADGGLALFNGTQEETPALIDLVLAQSGRSRTVQSALPEGGFIRLLVGRTLLFVDAGPPPPPGYDALSHAGTLSFELSVGRERLVTNCGAGVTPDWQEALRQTAAHSALIIGDRSSSDLSSGRGHGEPAGISRRPAHVEVEHKQSGGAHWLELSHDGYRPTAGAVHRRRLYLAENGEDVRGEDFVEQQPAGAPGTKKLAFVLRFHLHPDVTAKHDGEPGNLALALSSGAQWRMRIEGGAVAIDESVYLGAGPPRLSRQIVVSVAPAEVEAGVEPSVEPSVEPTLGSIDGEPQVVRWAISRAEA